MELQVPDELASAILNDAILNNQVDIVSGLLHSHVHELTNLPMLLQLAGCKASPELLACLLDDSRFTAIVNHLERALAAAIEAENLPNIKFLLMKGADIHNSRSIRKDVSPHLPRKRIWPEPKRTGFIRVFSLWNPILMSFLINECGVLLPQNLEDAGDIFRNPAFWRTDPVDVRSRLNDMRQYIRWPNAYSDGLYYLVCDDLYEGVRFCLDNGGNPNHRESWSSKSLLAEAVYTGSTRGSAKCIKLLLQFGADPVPYYHLRSRIGLRKIETYFGTSWDEIVRRTRAGDDMEISPDIKA